jgi:hypothetical protein
MATCRAFFFAPELSLFGERGLTIVVPGSPCVARTAMVGVRVRACAIRGDGVACPERPLGVPGPNVRAVDHDVRRMEATSRHLRRSVAVVDESKRRLGMECGAAGAE